MHASASAAASAYLLYHVSARDREIVFEERAIAVSIKEIDSLLSQCLDSQLFGINSP